MFAAPAAQATLRGALEAARARNLGRAREIQAGLSDPTARRIVDWALADIFGAQLGERHHAHLAVERAQRHALAEDVVA